MATEPRANRRARALGLGGLVYAAAAATSACRPEPAPAVAPQTPATQPDEDAVSNRSPGDPLDVTIPMVDGELLHTSGWNGRVVVVALSTGWSEPGATHLAFFSALRDQRPDAPMEVVVVSTGGTPAEATDWPEAVWAGWDPQGAVAARLRVRDFPTTFVIGPEGRLIEIVDGLDEEGRARISDAVAVALSSL